MSPRKPDADDLFDDESDDEELDALDGGELDDLRRFTFHLTASPTGQTP